MNAQQIICRIAASEAIFIESLFNPVTFPDGSRGTYSGFVYKRTVNYVMFSYLNKPNLVVNKNGVIGHWSKTSDGKTWYSYSLDPFGPDVKYSDECKAGKLIVEKFLKVSKK